MSKKQDIQFNQDTDFEEVERELSEALALLEEANTRVTHVLEDRDEEVPQSETVASTPEQTEEPEDTEADPDGSNDA